MTKRFCVYGLIRMITSFYNILKTNKDFLKIKQNCWFEYYLKKYICNPLE